MSCKLLISFDFVLGVSKVTLEEVNETLKLFFLSAH